jgi:hypothetical protein
MSNNKYKEEREGDPSSSQNMFAAATCSTACFSSLPPSQQKLNQASTKCLFEHVREKELRTSKKIKQLPRGKEKRARNQERKK